ncbi:hypothetical protein F5B22DRAFT_618634 [Xylaria bambusicola]|uniref:uncharacterized protein n=1 Tax=Xylaria bambusicola TaxID=326684 RepID=UPI0020088035|nr:uncharacterized protein F5B22DRAFT_618634 [Xylaria bambusicola]KAI0508921.1 hypothetical protein F5B22DRAFT_618634 [Xylaria bambusicola]
MAASATRYPVTDCDSKCAESIIYCHGEANAATLQGRGPRYRMVSKLLRVPLNVHISTILTNMQSPICLSSFSRKSEESPRPTDCDVNTSKAGLIKCEINNAPQSVEEEEEKEEEILVIRQCGHTFYAQCLVAWFMKGKYQCPVCRGRYYVPTKTERLAQLREMITA